MVLWITPCVFDIDSHRHRRHPFGQILLCDRGTIARGKAIFWADFHRSRITQKNGSCLGEICRRKGVTELEISARTGPQGGGCRAASSAQDKAGEDGQQPGAAHPNYLGGVDVSDNSPTVIKMARRGRKGDKQRNESSNPRTVSRKGWHRRISERTGTPAITEGSGNSQR